MLAELMMAAAVAAVAAAFNATDPASLQLPIFRQNTSGPIGILSLSSGCPVAYKYATTSINTNLLRNEFFIDSLNHLLSERIPERIVHAKGAGAFGYFEVTHDVAELCKAKFLKEIGKKTRVAARFSPVVPSRGGNDLASAVRGFSIRFYTEDGNFDIPGFNTPVFLVQDSVKFASFTHTAKPNPVTNINDNNMVWDYIISNPETFFCNLVAFSDRGIPASIANMPGYGIHTMQLSNCKNETNFARFHFTPDKGIKNMLPDDASKIGATDPDYLVRDLFNSIGRGHYPSWTVQVQALTLEDVQNARNKGFDVFDISKELPNDQYPLRPIGKLILNENPKNYFADVEQLAFCPGNIVPGILGSPDKAFEARAMSYRTAHAYRLGINFNKLRVNRPLGQIFTYNRDGAPTVDGNEGGAPNYYPNVFSGAEPVADNEPSLIYVTEIKSSNCNQSAQFYQNLPEEEKGRTASNIVASFQGLIEPLERKALEFIASVDQDLGDRVYQALRNSTKCG